MCSIVCSLDANVRCYKQVDADANSVTTKSFIQNLKARVTAVRTTRIVLSEPVCTTSCISADISFPILPRRRPGNSCRDLFNCPVPLEYPLARHGEKKKYGERLGILMCVRLVTKSSWNTLLSWPLYFVRRISIPSATVLLLCI